MPWTSAIFAVFPGVIIIGHHHIFPHFMSRACLFNAEAILWDIRCPTFYPGRGKRNEVLSQIGGWRDRKKGGRGGGRDYFLSFSLFGVKSKCTIMVFFGGEGVFVHLPPPLFSPVVPFKRSQVVPFAQFSLLLLLHRWLINICIPLLPPPLSPYS